MDLKTADTYLQECIERGYFEPEDIAQLDAVERLVFAMHTAERVKLGMFKEKGADLW